MSRSRSFAAARTPLVRLLSLAAALAVMLGLLSAAPASGVVEPADAAAGLDRLDAREGSVAPTEVQEALLVALGADRVSWNQFGTPRSLVKWGSYLASGLSPDPVAAARQFVSANRELFRLSDAGLDALEVVNAVPLGEGGSAVLFRQRFGSLPAAVDGLISVGVSEGRIAYVSSSSAGDGEVAEEATLSPTEAWLRAAASVGLDVAASAVSDVRSHRDWTAFDVAGLDQPQFARLRALPTPQDGVRPAYETIVLHNGARTPIAYTAFVDGVSGRVWVRENRVNELGLPAPSGGIFTGSTGPNGECGPLHEFEAPEGTREIVLGASGAVSDIILKLVYVEPDPDVVVRESDIPLGDNPEVIRYAPPEVPPGTYAAQVCNFNLADGSLTYAGGVLVNDTAGAGFPYPPRWRVFPANPPGDYSSTDTRELWCWESSVDGDPIPSCDRDLANDAARSPWDQNPFTDLPTFTTSGNQADSSEAWLNPPLTLSIPPSFINLTPGEQYRPVAPDRVYDFPWTNQWYESRCDPASFASVQRNDIDAAAANLFAMHDRMHDWSYFLGFTERTFNLQLHNFGIGAPGPFPVGRELDPEVGAVQSGGITGGPPLLGGRNNANQITLNDGIPGITNMYLWQPLTSFYAPCVDGDYDMSVIAHEYTHAISNRMVAGPDSNLSSSGNGQALAMGESWSDLAAVEYLNAYGFVPVGDENPFSVGSYVTGDRRVGIRNYGMNDSPLNYSNVQGWDPSGGTGPHEDGEIWSAVNHDIRQQLIATYGGLFPASNAALQRRCADGELPASHCPGNRRWMQIVFDAFLLMPAAVDMLDARDAYLAADVVRFGGANQGDLWQAFARRGMGHFAASPGGTDDAQPTPSFESPVHLDEATVTFGATAADEGGVPVDATIFVGDHEGAAAACPSVPCPGSTPVADTDPATALADTVRFVPGTYDVLYVAPGHGSHRFALRLAPGAVQTATASLGTNWASATEGALASGPGARLNRINDDTESSNWEATAVPNIQGRAVTVNLGATPRPISLVGVSGLLQGNQTGARNRFTPVRAFRVEACNATLRDCSLMANFKTIYTSAPDAFPADVPRPTTPEMIMRMFPVAKGMATHLRLVVLDNQCTGGPAYQGDQDNDPLNNSDCQTGSSADEQVRIAEFQAFGRTSTLGSRAEAKAP